MDRASRMLGPLAPGRRTNGRRRLEEDRARRPWQIAILASLAVHLLLAVPLLYFARSGTSALSANPPGTVELLMVEKRGSGVTTQSAHPADQAASSPPQTPPPQQRSAPQQEATSAPPATPDQAGEAVPAPGEQAWPKPGTPEREAAAEIPTRQVPPTPAQEAPVFDLSGTDSESNAIVTGDGVIPASPDDRFRNRPPIYPRDAAMRGEHGAVILMIHVSGSGTPIGADVAVTSGVAALDQAALEAVRKWRFRPAMKEGRGVPFDMPMRFIFDIQ